MVALSDDARLDRLENAIREIRIDVGKLGAAGLHLNEVFSNNDKELLQYIGGLSGWLEACRVLLEDIRERLSQIDGK
jgi:hypothetical protein